MMSFASAGFVLLSMPKAGSTALQRHFAAHADVVFRRPPGMKHMSAVTFEATMAPWLERYGRPRDSYETTCLVRHPVDRAVSWWRYRSRPELARADNSTREVSFAEFAEGLISGAVPRGTAANFVTDLAGEHVIVDRLYRYEHLDDLARWMAEQIGVPPPDGRRANASPPRELEVDAATRVRLEAHFAADVEVYESAR